MYIYTKDMQHVCIYIKHNIYKRYAHIYMKDFTYMVNVTYLLLNIIL